MYSEFFKKLLEMDWLISKFSYKPEDVIFNPIAKKRLQKAPKEFISFVTSYTLCSNIDDTTWFLSYLDYKDDLQDDQCWWNEFEKQCLDAADTAEDIDNCMKFWDMYLPFLMAIEDHYACVMICIEGVNKGKIYSSAEPEYEELTHIANSLDEFLELFLKDTQRFN